MVCLWLCSLSVSSIVIQQRWAAATRNFPPLLKRKCAMKVINLLCFSSKNPKRQHLDLIQKKAFSFSPSTSRVNTNWDRCGLELNQPQNDSHPPLLTKNYRGNTASSTNTCPHRSSPQTAPPGLTASLTANTQSYRVSMGRRLRRANQTVEKNGELPWSLPEPR